MKGNIFLKNPGGSVEEPTANGWRDQNEGCNFQSSIILQNKYLKTGIEMISDDSFSQQKASNWGWVYTVSVYSKGEEDKTETDECP